MAKRQETQTEMHKNDPALRMKRQMSEDKLASQQICDRVPGKGKKE